MSKSATWIKPSGVEVRVNDLPANIQAAKDLGWKLKEEPKKRGRKPKVDKEAE